VAPQSVEAFVELFRRAGFKITPQRRAVFEAVAGDDSHPTAEQIYGRIVAVMPDVSRTTVYNTLRDMVAVGALAEVEDLTAEGTRYDTNTDQHHHLFCMGCQSLIDIHREYDELEVPVDEAAGYRILRRQVTFYGYCPDCQKEIG